MQRGKTGGNMEPMPFVRKWGSEAEGNEFEGQMPNLNVEPIGDVSPKKHRHRDRSKSPTSKKEKKRSRSPDKKRHKKRSRSREGKNKKRSKSRERKKNREEKDREEEQQISAFPPPADILQQVYLRQQQIEMQIQQQEAARQQQIKEEIAEQQSQQQDWQQQYYANQFGSQQHEPNQPKNDALSAALAAAAAVSQKLNKFHGGTVGTTSTAATDIIINKFPQAPTRNTAVAEAILSKDSNGIKKEPGQEPPFETETERRKKSRWSNTKAFVPGMPTILPSDIDDNQRQIYLFQMDIEESTRRLRQGDFGQNLDPSERSPSPEPIYDATGKRLNTREIRKRQELEQRRHEKIQALLKLNPMYKPPADYRPPNIKLNDKVWIPQEEHPEINFVGLLIGPRGNTLKALEAETGCKIIIRGKGSIKEGKLGARTGPLPGENEPLHAYVTATDREAIKRGCEKIREIVNAALMIPDGQNELRKLQLRELALLNGTLRPEDILSGARCSNCGSDQHKTWECMEAPNVTASTVCALCGGAGHIAKDCKNPRIDPAMIDSEYSALMAELGQKTPTGVGGVGQQGGGQQPIGQPTPLAFITPGQPTANRPRYSLPSQAPIVRVNLAKTNQQPGYPSWAIDGPSAFYGFSGLPGQDPAAAAAAWVAWQQGGGSQQGYPAPVPPPPGGSEGDQNVSGANTSTSSSGGLAMFPPPPPPPPPVPKAELKEEFDSIFSAPPPPS